MTDDTPIDTTSRAVEHEQLRDALRHHVASASHEELGVLIDHLSDALQARVGTYAPFIQHAVKGIRDTLRKADGLPVQHAPARAAERAASDR